MLQRALRQSIPQKYLCRGMAKGAGKLRIKRRDAKVYYPDEALALVRSVATARFDETLELALQLAIDPRKPGQTVRGATELPHGTGKRAIIAVFARDAKAEEAKAAGADIVGLEDLVERISNGEIAFTKAIATPDVMPIIGKVARILGPRGLMPNPKVGTLTQDIKGAVKSARRGQVEFRAERRGIVHAPLGKMSFSDKALLDNLRTIALAVHDARPENFSGQFFRHATLSSTQGRGVHVDIATLDPSKPRFMASKFEELRAAQAAAEIAKAQEIAE